MPVLSKKEFVVNLRVALFKSEWNILGLLEYREPLAEIYISKINIIHTLFLFFKETVYDYLL